jgi:DNA-binding NtrC family response regulator
MTKETAVTTNVLVVDDDPEILEILEERLRMEGFEVEGTTSPIQSTLTNNYNGTKEEHCSKDLTYRV